MPALTLREVLALDPVRASEPELLAGEAALDRPVRWVHSSEVYEGANFLDGGELLLTNGFGLTDTAAEIRRRYVRELAARGASGLAVEIGRSLPTMPPEVTDEARRLGPAPAGPAPGRPLRADHRGSQPGDRRPRTVRPLRRTTVGRRPHRRTAGRPRGPRRAEPAGESRHGPHSPASTPAPVPASSASPSMARAR
ncbi:PucR family transcriptional regulator ligand-binding domain-containing protein [Streptomyces sp. L7]